MQTQESDSLVGQDPDMIVVLISQHETKAKKKKNFREHYTTFF